MPEECFICKKKIEGPAHHSSFSDTVMISYHTVGSDNKITHEQRGNSRVKHAHQGCWNKLIEFVGSSRRNLGRLEDMEGIL